MALRLRPAMAWLGAALALGCSVPEFETASTEATPNQCQADSDCGAKGHCVAGACRATDATFTNVLFEITPPSDADPVADTLQAIPIAGIRFLKFIQGLSRDGGVQNIALDHVAHVMGKVIPHECVTTAGARVTFTPSEQVLGLPTQSYTADAKDMSFDQWMPPGAYDIYIQPAEGATDGCVVPQLIENRLIPAADVELELIQPVPAEIDVTISWPAIGSSVEGWTLDVVDYMSGRVLSEQKPISVFNSMAPVGERAQYFVPVRYVPVTGGELGKELVRLSPPSAGDPAPTLLMQRSALELFNQGTATIDQVVELPSVVTFSGRVTTEDPDQGVLATVTLIASKCDGLADGTLAAFEREVVTNPDGSFSVDVLAGLYSAYAVPAGGSGYAAKVDTLEIAALPSQQSGKLIQLAPSTLLSGRLLDPSGSEPLSGASVYAVASPTSIQTTEFDLVRGLRPFVPRASTGCDRNALCNIVGEDGLFSIEADPGHFDVSVRPPETTGFSWVVRPNVPVSSELEDLGDVKMPAPVAYTGVVTAPNGAPVARALIRAYVYMSSVDDLGRVVYLQDADVAKSVLQIGETRAGDDASFTLLLPSGWE